MTGETVYQYPVDISTDEDRRKGTARYSRWTAIGRRPEDVVPGAQEALDEAYGIGKYKVVARPDPDHWQGGTIAAERTA